VSKSEFSGETQILEYFHTGRVTGKVCYVTFKIAGRSFRKRAVTLPGKLLQWTSCMAVPLGPREEMEFVLNQIGVKEAACKEDTRYLPPTMNEDVLVSGLMVCDGVVVNEKIAKNVTGNTVGENSEVLESGSSELDQEVTSSGESEVSQEDISEHGVQESVVNDVEEEGDHGELEEEVMEERLGAMDGEEALVCVEEGGELPEGSAGEDSLMLESIGCSIPRTALAKATAED